MTFERRSRAPLTAIWQTAISLLIAVQVVLAFAPLLEGRFGADARTHVEATGVNVHHAHNPESCPACAARGLLAAANRADTPAAIESHQRTDRVAPKGDDRLAEFLKGSISRPRAPPFRQA